MAYRLPIAGLSALLLAQGATAQTLLVDAFYGNSPYVVGPASTITANDLIVGHRQAGFLSQTGGSLTAIRAYVGSGGVGNFIQDGGLTRATSLYIAWSTSGSYTLNQGELLTTSTYIGQNFNNGLFTQNGGRHETWRLQLSPTSSQNHRYDLKGGLLQTGETTIALFGSGTFVQSAGTHQVDGPLTVGLNHQGAYSLSGAASLLTTKSTSVCAAPANIVQPSVFLQSAGRHDIGGALRIGPVSTQPGASVGHYLLSGGSLSCASVRLSHGSALQIAGGTCDVTSGIEVGPLAVSASSSNVIFLESGTLTVGGSGITAGPSEGTLVFDGGTLRAGASWNLLHPLRIGNTRGGTIDTQGFEVGLLTPVRHDDTLSGPDGGLRKVGSGLLRLCASNEYTGPTELESGTLELCAGGVLGSGRVRVAPGALFRHEGLMGGDLVVEGTARTAGQASVAGGLLVVAGGLLEIDQGTLTVQGPITNAGLIRVRRDGRLTALGSHFVNTGVLDLITGTATLPPGFVNQGVVLDSSAVRITNVERTPAEFILRVRSHAGHRYQVQKSSDLRSGTFLPLGSAQDGMDSQELEFRVPLGPEASGFYRVEVDP